MVCDILCVVEMIKEHAHVVSLSHEKCLGGHASFLLYEYMYSRELCFSYRVQKVYFLAAGVDWCRSSEFRNIPGIQFKTDLQKVPR